MKFIELKNGDILNLEHVVYISRHGDEHEWEICFDVDFPYSACDEPHNKGTAAWHLSEDEAQEIIRELRRRPGIYIKAGK